MRSTLSIERRPDGWRLSGRLTAADNGAFTEMVSGFAQCPGPEARLDLSALEHMDSFGVGLVLMAREEASRLGLTLAVTGVQGEVERLFRLSGLEAFLASGAPPRKVPPSPFRPPATGLTIKGPSRDGDGEVFHLVGRFSFADCDAFAVVHDHLSEVACAVTLDLDGLDFLDSGGLSMILIAREAADRRGVRLVLRRPRGRVERLFDLAGLRSTLPIEA